jgi:hypothetical protein
MRFIENLITQFAPVSPYFLRHRSTHFRQYSVVYHVYFTFLFWAEGPVLTFIKLLATMVGRFGNAELEKYLKEYCRILIEFNSHCVS